ncbi:DNA topology modulation protein [soil metagenome]
MNHLKRIAIIGNAGSGKSTLAKKLHAIFNLPVYHLDQYYFKPNWVKPDPEEYKKNHDSLCDKDEWIIEGINLKLLDYRASHADMIIFLAIPRYKCLWGIFRRAIRYYGKETPSSALGCPENLRWEFIRCFKWAWDFKKNYHPKIREILQQHPDKQIYILKSRKEIDTLVSGL